MLNDSPPTPSGHVFERPVPHLDRVAAVQWMGRARSASPWLNEEAARRMLERLACIKVTPDTWVDWAPAWGGAQVHRALVQQWPNSTAYAVDAWGKAAEPQGGHDAKSKRWNPWAWLKTERGPTPPPVGVQDVVWANMVLHLSPQPKALMQQWQRLLKIDGFVMFSALGPDTLKELRGVYQTMGWPEPMHPLTDMHDWGDMLVELGFAAPVMDVDRFKLTYPDAQRMLDDLRDWGRNLNDQRFQALRGRGWRERWLQAVEQHGPRDAAGQLTLSVELVFGHAVKTAPKLPMAPSVTVGLDAMREQLRRPKPGNSHAG
jgi:malonyl-CoA O-methyltransferase